MKVVAFVFCFRARDSFSTHHHLNVVEVDNACTATALARAEKASVGAGDFVSQENA